MTWTITLHPALTGDVSTTSPDSGAFITDLLRLEQDGGMSLKGVDFPASFPNELLLKFRALQLSCGAVIIMNGSMAQCECCVLGLAPASLCDDKDAYAAWGETLLQRAQRLHRNDVESLYLPRFFDMFEPSAIAAAEAVIIAEYQHTNRRDLIASAVTDLDLRLSDLLSLDKRQRHRLTTRVDFMLQHLRSHLEHAEAEIYLGIRFKDDVFEFKNFKDLGYAKD